MEAKSLSWSQQRDPWNKGKLVGQKAPFKPKDIWAMRMRLQQEHRSRDLASKGALILARPCLSSMRTRLTG